MSLFPKGVLNLLYSHTCSFTDSFYSHGFNHCLYSVGPQILISNSSFFPKLGPLCAPACWTSAPRWHFRLSPVLLTSPLFCPPGLLSPNSTTIHPFSMPGPSVPPATSPPLPPTFYHISLWHLSTSSISLLSSCFRPPSLVTQPLTANLAFLSPFLTHLILAARVIHFLPLV